MRPGGAWWGIISLLVMGAGCAVEGPPPGGKPDVEAPEFVAAVPPDGSVGVARTGGLSLTFSEPMDHRGTERAFFMAPEIRWARFVWEGTTLVLVPADLLDPDRVYVAVVGRQARDRRGNALGAAMTVGFTTGERLPAGELRGRVVPPLAAGDAARVYALPAGAAADSMSGAPALEEAKALSAAETDSIGGYALRYLPAGVPVWVAAYVDRNRNGHFDPTEPEPWGWHPVPLEAAEPDSLPAEARSRETEGDSLRSPSPGTERFTVRLFDPAREGVVRGRVANGGGAPPSFVIARSAADSGKAQVESPQAAGGEFIFPLVPGQYRMGVFRDRNGNRQADPAREPAEGDSAVATPVEEEPIVWATGEVTVVRGEIMPAIELVAPPADSSMLVPAGAPAESEPGVER